MRLRSLHLCLALLALLPASLPAAERVETATSPGSVATARVAAISTTLLEALALPLASTAEASTAGGNESPTAAVVATEAEYYWLLTGHGVRLAFDLANLPAGLSAARMQRCVVRVVASEVRYVREHEAVAAVVELAVRRVGETRPLAALRELRPDRPVSLNPDNGRLCEAVAEAAATPARRLELELYTGTSRASSLLYGRAPAQDTLAHASRTPRLVIQYTFDAAATGKGWRQPQHDAGHSGRGEFKPAHGPGGFELQALPLPAVGEDAGPGLLAERPLLWRDQVIAVQKRGKRNYLFALDGTGALLWSSELGGGVVQRTPVIGPQGLLYLVTEDAVRAWDLEARGALRHTFVLPELAPQMPVRLSPFSKPTVGEDGSLYLVLGDGVDGVLGLDAQLRPFLFFGLNEGAGTSTPGSPAQSIDGRRLAVPTGGGAVVIDLHDPAEAERIAFGDAAAGSGWRHHLPVAGARVGEWIFSGYDEEDGTGAVWAFAGRTPRWQASGGTSTQPVLAPDGRAWFVQDGTLNVRGFGPGDAGKRFGEGLCASSNPVMDGAGNVFFWCSGTLHGFAPDGRALFVGQRFANAPEENLALALGTDGSLWTANANGGELFVFRPRFGSPSAPASRPAPRRPGR
ncbi:MAG: hypothetical protein ABTQ28_16210 [Thauera sp.]|jgi:hypothetical protein